MENAVRVVLEVVLVLVVEVSSSSSVTLLIEAEVKVEVVNEVKVELESKVTVELDPEMVEVELRAARWRKSSSLAVCEMVTVVKDESSALPVGVAVVAEMSMSEETAPSRREADPVSTSKLKSSAKMASSFSTSLVSVGRLTVTLL